MKYDYRCSDCDSLFIVEHSMKEDKDSLGLTCTECDSTNIKRYLGNRDSVPILFKGVGWVVNDSAIKKVGAGHLLDNPAAREKMKKRI